MHLATLLKLRNNINQKLNDGSRTAGKDVKRSDWMASENKPIRSNQSENRPSSKLPKCEREVLRGIGKCL